MSLGKCVHVTWSLLGGRLPKSGLSRKKDPWWMLSNANAL